MIKLFEWLSWTAAMVCCCGWWLVAELTRRSVTRFFPQKHLLMPAITHALILKPWWILLLPLPWLGFLVVRWRKRDTMEAALVFAATALCVMLIVSFLVVLACIIPWLPCYF